MSLLLHTPLARSRRILGTAAHRLTGRSPRSPLTGRTVLVTGASSGIGEATAVLAAERGAVVLLVARRVTDLERVRQVIENNGGVAAAYPCDLTDPLAIDTLVATVIADHGTVDYLVNNAGRSIRRSLELSGDRLHDFDRTMAINSFGPVRLTMGLLPAMRAQRFGQVVNVVSWGVQLKAPKYSAYLASKAALDTWSRIAGRETYGENVTFTNMRFGLVRTAMVVPTQTVEDRRAMSPHAAGLRVVRALEERPLTVNPLVGSVGEVLNLALPRVSDAVMHRFHRSTPDSPAARGETTD